MSARSCDVFLKISAAGRWVSARTRRWLVIARLSRAAGGPLLAAALALNLLLGLLPAAFVVAMSVLLDRVAKLGAGTGPDSWAGILTVFGFAAGLYMAQQLLAPFQAAVGELVGRRVDGASIRRLMAGAMEGAPLEALERKDVLDELNDARGAFDYVMPTPGQAVAAGFALIARYVQLVAACVLVAVALHPVAGLIVLATALTVRFGQRGSLWRFAALWHGLAGKRRKMEYLRELGAGTAAAKEARVLGLVPWLRQRHDQVSRGYLQPLWEGRRRLLFWPFVGFAAAALAGGAAVFGWLSQDSSSAGFSMLRLAITLQGTLIAIRFGVYFPECDTQTQYGLQAEESQDRFRSLVSADARQTPPTGGTDPAAQTDPRAKAERAIRLENVSFGYGGGDRLVLDGLDLDIPVGTSTAIVGLNGAGKTTLVKLLTGLYRPTGGRITADGADIADIPVGAWQRQFAAVFQDYNRYELTVAENIALGAPHLGVDESLVRAAAERADADGFVESLPHGFDTVLSRHYDGGQDLSGGQWQRIGLARAYYAVAGGARVLVLDEPTAQLDVRSEVEFFDRFLERTRNLTSVVISHRFSTVRRADRIVVLENGRIAESGSHDELLKLDGRYAALFRLQAQRFADEDAESAEKENVA
jgi:ATP-binding cassette subfamily B protein